MRKFRKAAVVATVIGSVGVIGAGVASAYGEPEDTDSVSITCEQDTGDNTLTTQTGGVANVSDALNGGDANTSTNQQLCGLDNEGAENGPTEPEVTGGTEPPATGATGGAGGIGGSITLGADGA
ncbi:hypothetical protein [Streptomyces winkii]|uniref:hypothetical protein n=1 Tax=Streptomyces winkii TaxID=3051178 RepID=UPI0028D748D2|nr:hypothetical protein [Streptomyces sp. DSM 40971]